MAGKVNTNYEVNWDPQDWENVMARMPRKCRKLRVINVIPEVSGSPYYGMTQDAPGTRRGFWTWFLERWIV